MCLFCFMYEQCLFRTFSQGFFLIYSIRLCFLSFHSKHPLHHVICLQRSHLYLLTWTLASLMHILRIQLWQCNSLFCYFCFINVLQFLSLFFSQSLKIPKNIRFLIQQQYSSSSLSTLSLNWDVRDQPQCAFHAWIDVFEWKCQVPKSFLIFW